MEQHRNSNHSLKLLSILVFSYCWLICPSVSAQEECGTVKECAQAMVGVVNDLKKENEALLERIEQLEKTVSDQAATLRTERINALAALGKGVIHKPNKGSGATDQCSEGRFMIGARLHPAGGDHAGLLYNFYPICRDFR